MSTTAEYFNATKAQPLTGPAGNLTQYQVAAIGDALTGVFVCCNHAFGAEGMEPHFQQRIDRLGKQGHWSLAKCRRVLVLWNKWTRATPLGEAPCLSTVASFLFDLHRI